ncbi:hypothetical protein ACP275_12G177500 [Erythranthe tilingii]
MGSNRCNNSSKERLKWTKELHDLFEKAVHQIGGPDRATPRGILRAMAIPELTILHVKSHLQKYRMSVFTREEDHIGGKFEKTSASEMLPNFSAISSAQLNEALLIQMEAQRRLSDQLEVQKSLKTKIEAQGRYLDKIMEEYKNRAPGTKLVKPYSPILSMPCLSEESDQSNIGKEFESDSEVMSKDEFRAQKRIKIQDDVILPHIHKHSGFFNPAGSHHQSLSMFCVDGLDNNIYTEQEISFPWSVSAFQSQLLPRIYNPLNQ